MAPNNRVTRKSQFRFTKETVLEEDNNWYDANILGLPHDFDSYTPKLVALTDSLYHIAVANPSTYVKLLVSSSGIENLKSEEDKQNVFSKTDIQRIKNLMRPEYIKKIISVRKASYILELALSPFFKVNFASDWYVNFKALKESVEIDEDTKKKAIRVQLFSVAMMLMEGWDLILYQNFTWDIPSNINNDGKVNYIIDHELIPTGSNDPRFQMPRYGPLFKYLDELRISRNNKTVRGGSIKKRKTIRNRPYL